MANTTKTLETIKHLKNITENIILDKELPGKMGPIFFPIMKDQLLQNMKDLNAIQFQVEMLHFGSQFPQAFSLKKHEILSPEEKVNTQAKRNQTLKNITDILQYHFANNPSQTDRK